MAIGPLPPVINEIQANSGQPGKTLTQQAAAGSLVDVQAAATSELTVAIVPESTLIEKAVAEALGRQGGLAPLYATLVELVDAPDLPDAVKAAINTLLAFRLGDSDVTPERVAEAIRASGLFHEAVAAGKMAAVLPPAIRQALGGSPSEKRQSAGRPQSAPSPAILAIATTPASVASGASPPTGTPSPAAGIHLSQAGALATTAPAGNPTASAAGVVRPSVAPAAVAAPVAAQTTSPDAILIDALAPSVGSAAAPPASSATGETQQQGQPPTSGTPSSLPATAGIAQSAPAPAAIPLPSVGDGGAAASLPPAAEPVPAAPSSPLPPTSGTPMPAHIAGSPVPSSGDTAQSAPLQMPASGPAETGSSASLAPAASSALPAGASASSRAFAPWTPGRPLAQAASPAPQAAPTPSPTGLLSDGVHPQTLSATTPSGRDAVPRRLPGDKAPFVPSTVDSLPNAPSGLATPQRAASPPVVPLVATQPATDPSMAPALALEPGSGPAAAQGALPPRQSSQTQPTVAAGTESFSPLAQQAKPPPAAAPLAVGIDLKGALEVLRRELVVWLGRNADVMASLDGPDGDAAARLDRPLPPRKGGPMRGQPAVPLLGNDEAETASTEKLAGRALGEAERSLSRVFLHQATTADSRDLKAAHATQAFVFEIPIAGPSGTSVAQLRIERDDHAPNEPGAPLRRVFQVDIAFDVAPLGPVAVRVGLMDGRRVAVGVWCESDDGLVRMEAERENIVLGLEQEGMVVAGVDLHRGHPPEGRDETAAAASHRLDLQL